MSARDRVATCRMAVDDSNWIEVCDMCSASGDHTGDMLKKEIMCAYGVVLTPILVYGADFIVKCGEFHLGLKKPVVCVGRGDDTRRIEEMLRRQCVKDGMEYTGTYGLFHLAESGGGDVSSTKIRAFVQRRDWFGLAASGTVHPRVVAFLKEGH